MSKPLSTPPLARTVERDSFGALLGSLLSTLVARFLLIAFEIPAAALIGLLALGAVAGAFAAHYASRSSETVLDSFRTWNTRLRRVSLKVMLWMLVLAGITGVVTVLTASYDTLGRVAGTVIATAIVAGVLWPTSVLADREKTQAAGLLGMVAAVVVYLLVLPLIWDLDRQDDEILITSLVIGLTVPFGMFFLGLIHVPSTWIAARVGVGTYVTVLALFLVSIWHPGRWASAHDWAITGWWCAAYGSLSFASLCGLRRFTIDWRWLGVIAAFLAWAIVMIGVWGEDEPADKTIIVITSIAVVLAHASLAALVPLRSGQQWLRLGTIGALAVTAVFLDLEVVLEPDREISMLGRISGAAAIVASCGSLALLIFARLNRVMTSPSEPVDLKDISQLELFCPRCQSRQTLPIGTHSCKHCGLQITTAISETDSPFPADEEEPIVETGEPS